MNRLSRAIALAFALVLGIVTAELSLAQGPVTDSLLAVANESRVKGVETAPITIIEIGDFQCPDCRDFSQRTLPAVDSAFISTGRARLAFYNLPLPGHASAFPAAEAALCAGLQRSFWRMHDRLFLDQPVWAATAQPAVEFERYATQLGLDVAAFRECTQNDRVAPILVADLIQAARGGANSTPTFVILRQQRPGEAPDAAQRTIVGSAPFSEFEKAFAELERVP